MIASFATGALAGLAVAMPPGAIATLILATGLRRGFPFAAAAGLGTATVDFAYALVAMLLGSAVSSLLSGVERPLQVVTGVVLVAFGVWGASRALRRPSDVTTGRPGARDLLSTYVRFVALTALNPATLGYFVAVAIGLGTAAIADVPAFALGVLVASAGWQLLLAAVSGALHGRLPDQARRWAGVGGNVIVVLLGVAVLARAILA